VSEQLRHEVTSGVQNTPRSRLKTVLKELGIRQSTWYRKKVAESERRRPGPDRVEVPDTIAQLVKQTAQDNPWYGYHKIAIMCRWINAMVKDRQVYRVMAAEKLLQNKRSRKIELYQASKLYELLPSGPNQLWQMDVTYVHIPGYGWWYVVTVIDYYSRFLLAARLVSSYCAHEVTEALSEARQEAERIHGPLEHLPYIVTDNGSSFIAKRFKKFVADTYRHVRIQYRTPQQLGLLERFHETLKQEEVYWRLYDNPEHARTCIAEFRKRYNHRRPHWALIPEDGGDATTPMRVYAGGARVKLPKWQAWARKAKSKIDTLMNEAA